MLLNGMDLATEEAVTDVDAKKTIALDLYALCKAKIQLAWRGRADEMALSACN